MNWYFEVLKKYAVFTGRARRSEYWYFCLFNILAGLIAVIFDSVIGKLTGVGIGLFGMAYGLAVLVPGIAVSVRRLHDTDRSGWWVLLALVPFGAFVLLVFMVQDSVAGSNRYGSYPKLVRA